MVLYMCEDIIPKSYCVMGMENCNFLCPFIFIIFKSYHLTSKKAI